MNGVPVIALIPVLCVGCRNVPSADTLELPTDPVAITIVQRRSESVPGSRGRIRLEIDDVTAGQVLTKLTFEDGDDLVPQQSMRIGDTVGFFLDGRQLSLGLARLVNRLFGDDHAVFLVGSPGRVVTAQIEDFLERIETSKHTFVRFGEDRDGPAMARHLRREWSTMAGEIHTADQFIDKVVETPATSSRACQVRIGDVTVAWRSGCAAGEGS